MILQGRLQANEPITVAYGPPAQSQNRSRPFREHSCPLVKGGRSTCKEFAARVAKCRTNRELWARLRFTRPSRGKAVLRQQPFVPAGGPRVRRGGWQQTTVTIVSPEEGNTDSAVKRWICTVVAWTRPRRRRRDLSSTRRFLARVCPGETESVCTRGPASETSRGQAVSGASDVHDHIPGTRQARITQQLVTGEPCNACLGTVADCPGRPIASSGRCLRPCLASPCTYFLGERGWCPQSAKMGHARCP